MQLLNRKYPATPHSVPGDFYVQDNCCTMCGVPEAEAPDLFGGFGPNDEVLAEQCFVKKQPETQAEYKRMLSVIACADLSCIRYAGTEPKLIELLIQLDEAYQIDHLPTEDEE